MRRSQYELGLRAQPQWSEERPRIPESWNKTGSSVKKNKIAKKQTDTTHTPNGNVLAFFFGMYQPRLVTLN